MSTELTLWKEQLLAELPGAPWSFVEMQLRGIIDNFYSWSGSWIDDIELNLKAGRKDYRLNPQPNTVVLYVITAEVDGVIKYPRHAASSVGSSFTVSKNGVLTLDVAPTADVSNGLVVKVMLKPMPGCESYPDDLGNVWYETIRYGVLGRMQAMSNKPWSDVTNAGVNQRRFRAGMAQARDVARKGYAVVDAPVAFPPW